MNQTEYQRWMERAFLYVEAALSMELSTPSRVCMSEEYLRSSFVRGLSHSMPEEANRVSIEWGAPWSDRICWHNGCGATPGQGRKVQHDVRIKPKAANESGLACEVKWLKQAKSEEIVRDIWKLMLSRSVNEHGGALRCYLLVGGEGVAFKNTMDTLRRNMLSLKWRVDSGATTDFNLNSQLNRPLAHRSLKEILVWGGGNHVRTPDRCLGMIRCVRRASWYRTLDSIKWRMGMWELTSWGAEAGTVDWTNFKATIVQPSGGLHV